LPPVSERIVPNYHDEFEDLHLRVNSPTIGSTAALTNTQVCGTDGRAVRRRAGLLRRPQSSA